MISVLDHIEYLISKHDCVIVPGLGAFISHYSVVKNITETTIGLKKEISFNPSIEHNDGLLANSISRKDKISFDLANIEIANYVNSLRSQLFHEGEVPVGRIGYFCNISENNLVFYPFPTRIGNNEFFGLSTINIKPIPVINLENVNKNISEKTIITPLSRKIMRVAASIVLLIGMVLVLSTPVINDNNQDYANLNAFTLKTPELLEDNELLIAIPNITIDDINTTIEDNNVAINPKRKLSNSNGNYGIVVASLATEAQVEKYVRENALSQYEVFKSSSKYRVYIVKGSYNEMISLKENMYANSDAWVCRIK